MIRLTAIVSGNVQRVGYRARVIDIANAFGIKGMTENQKDGLVKIIAEGEEEKLRWFESAIDIKNALIRVSSIDKKYSQASGDFESFGKLVLKGETDSRLDTAAEYLKEIVVSVNKMNENLGRKMDQMLDKQDATIGEIQALRTDLKGYMDMRFKRIESDLSELKDMKVALKEKGLI